MLRILTIFISAAFVFFCSVARAEEVPIPPTPSRWVTDTVGFLSPETQKALDQRLEQYESQSKLKVAVWIGATAGEGALETWATSAVDAWRAEQAAFGKGVVMFILTQDKAIDIEVAQGLEKQLPDEFLSQVIFQHMAPRLQKDDPNGALTAGVDSLLTKLQTPMVEPAAPAAPDAGETKVEEPAEQPAESTQSPPATTKAPGMPSTLLFVALGSLMLISFIAIGAAGLSRTSKKSS